MELYRVFVWDEAVKNPYKVGATRFREGAPLYVPKDYQGDGRHDIKEDAIYYCSKEAISAIAEGIKDYRNLSINDDDFRRPNKSRLALAKLALDDKAKLIDFTDANQLVKFNMKPANIATHEREITQALSNSVYNMGAGGFVWWSTLEATWSNVTLFASRVKNKIKIADNIEPLNVKMKLVREAAKLLGINID